MALVDGYNPTVVVQHDIARLFQGINVRSTDTTALKQQFVSNCTASFTALEVLPE
ncbi:MAG: hypothetical protein R2795_19415 [Saprospiraceae bacterium]